VCVPALIFLPCQVAAQEVAFVHVCRVVLSALIVMDASVPLGSLAETAIFTEPFPLMVLPFSGEVIVTVGGAGIVTDTDGDGADVPAVL
jgi:hypothetical protein